MKSQYSNVAAGAYDLTSLLLRARADSPHAAFLRNVRFLGGLWLSSERSPLFWFGMKIGALRRESPALPDSSGERFTSRKNSADPLGQSPGLLRACPLRVLTQPLRQFARRLRAQPPPRSQQLCPERCEDSHWTPCCDSTQGLCCGFVDLRPSRLAAPLPSLSRSQPWLSLWRRIPEGRC